MVNVVDGWGMTAPKTKQAVAALRALGAEPRERVLIVLGRDDEVAWKSFRNLGERVALCTVEELNVYDVLVADRVVFTTATLDAIKARGQGPEVRGLPESAGVRGVPGSDGEPA
jgi:large subunit ribosomal protein L4